MMKRKMLLLIGALIIAGASFGQLTGTKTIGSAGPNDYPTIAAAIEDLNLQGVGPGGVTFNIAAGYTETFLSPTAGTITATGSASSPVIFQKYGSGSNPVITAAIGTSTNFDGIIKLAGGDYFTFDGIDLLESPANTTATTQMEWGYALVKARNTFPVDGSQYITIKNCSISLNGSNTASSGIYSGNHIATTTSPAPNGTIYTSSDYSGNCKFYGNTISNVFKGFNLNGYNDNINNPPTSFDVNNEIGMAGAGNTIIQNVTNSSSICYGIWAHHQTNLKIAYNTITGNNLLGAMYGITPRVSNSVDIHHNTISVSSAGTSGSYGIDLYAGGSPGYTTEIHDNLIQNCVLTGSAGLNAIYGGTAIPAVLNIYANTITGITLANGTMNGITLGGGGGNITNIYENLIYNNTKTGPGNFYCISNVNYKDILIHDNQIYSNNIAITGIVTAASTLTGIQSGQNGQTSETIFNNHIYDLNITGTTTALTNAIYGINTDIISPAARNWYNNVVHDLSISAPAGSGTVVGMRTANGSTSNIYSNQVYNLYAANAAGAAQGINIASGSQVNVYNNFVSDLKTPASGLINAINGITIAGGTNAGLYYNTIYLNASSTAPVFGTSGIYKSGATTLTDLRNNVIMNLSTPGSAGGFAVAYQWSAAYNAAYYAPASNANNFYAGTPSTSNLVFFDGINSDQTFAGYQSRVTPKDALSFSENSPLMNTASAPYDLHMSTSVGTLCESGGVAVLSPAITTDVDGNPRTSTPDVGADEFNGMTLGVVNPTGFAPVALSSQQINLPFTLNLQGNPVAIVWNTTGFFTSPSGSVPALNSSFAGGTLLSAGTTSPVSHTGLNGGTTYYYKAFSYDGSSWSTGVPTSAITSVAPPVTFNAYALSTSRIDQFWTKNALDNDVIVAVNTTNTFGQPVNGTSYAAGNALPTAGTVIYAGPLSNFSQTLLPASTKYYYKAWSMDTFTWYSATGLTTNATTMTCEPTANLPFTENFDSYTPPAIGCGTIIDGNSDGLVWGSFTVTASTAHSGTKVLSLPASGASVNADDWYFIRGLNLVEGQKYQLTFFYRNQYTEPASYFEVKWGTSPTPMGMYNPALFTIATPNNFNPYPSASCIVTAPASGTYYFGWHATNNPYANIYIDDITVTTTTCATPLAVSAGALTTTSADISWTGGASNVQIDYGTVGHVAGTGTLVSASTNPQTLSTLAPSTAYNVFVRQDCGSGSYSFWAGPTTFTTLYAPPAVTTDAATALTGSGATLNGTINANGVSTLVFFEYGLTTAYGFSATATPTTVTGTASTPVSAIVSGLMANGNTYHFRAVGYSGGVFTYGADQTLVTTHVVPTVVTAPVTALTSTGAMLNGTVNANNTSATTGFDYGTTDTYELGSVTGTPSTVIGSATANVSAPIAGLVAGTLYHYRVSATNDAGIASGSDMTFIAADPPTVTTDGYLWTTATSNGTIVLNGTVNANNYATTVTFHYGPTTAYGTIVNAVPLTVTGNSPTNVATAAITFGTNTLNALFHYRTVAVNAAGTTYGPDMTFTTPIAPLATTSAATFPVGGLTLNGTVNANNANTTVIYEYGPTTAYGSTVAFPSNPVTGTFSSNRATILTGLTPGATYHFRVTATNIAGTTNGADFSVVVPALPTATTLPATLVTATTTRLNGTIVTLTTPTVSTNYRYEYGLTAAYGTTVNSSPASGTTNGTFSPVANLTGLIPNTNYHYRIFATNAAGSAYGSDMTFTTTGLAPTVTTVAALGITPESATFNGTVNPNNSTATAGFEYGLDNTYGNMLPALQSPVSGNTVKGVSATIAGLMPNTVYHYRTTATNPTGTSTGTDMTFTTMSVLPTAVTTAATMVTPVGATLNGTVNANNASTAVMIEYGLTDGYGSMATALPSTVTGNTATGISAVITGLLPNTLYHYRVNGTNAAGSTYGNDMTFTTPFDIVFTATPTQPLCFGEGGIVTFNVTGGTPPYTFDPTNPATSGLAAGTYVYHLTDATGYPASANATINAAPSQLVISAVVTQPLCFGETGSVALSTAGGTPDYTYSPANPPLSGLTDGTYTYWVIDANGCQASVSATVNAPLLVINNPGICEPAMVNLTNPAVTAGSHLYGAVLSYWVDANATIPLNNPTSVGPGTYYIKATLNPTCFDIQPVTATITPAPTRYYATGGGSYCAGGAGAVVGLEDSEIGVNYSLWNYYGQLTSPIPGTGGPISFGPQTTTGPIMVIGENASGCSSWSYNTLIITVTQPVPVSVTITASSNPAGAGQNVIFTAHPVNGGAYASYQWKVNGFAAGSTASTYTYQPADGDVVSCVLTSSLTCITGSPAMSNDITMTVTGIPANITITGTVSNGQENCYNATQTLTVAGGATTFVVETDGSATMIAGQNIIYLPGTTIHEGGYMHGYISTMYCGQQSPSIVNTITGNGELPLTSQNSSFTIYPNPTNGNFTLVIKGDKTYGNVTVEVYSMQGERVMTESMIGEQKHNFMFSAMPTGLYFVKVIADSYVETIKLVKTR